MGCDCVPYKVCCVGEVVYCAGAIEGAGMANSVAIVMIDVWFRRKDYSNELVAKVIRAIGEDERWFRDNVQPWGRVLFNSMQTEAADATKIIRMSRRTQEDR
jgi:hypothetical protein